MTDIAAPSYRSVLRDRRLAALLFGDLVSQTGTGMTIIALPLQTLLVHGTLSAPIAIAMVETANYVLATVLAFVLGLAGTRAAPRLLLLSDCALRASVFTALGVLAVIHALSLWTLVFGLLFGSVFRLAGSSSRRLIATKMVSESGKFVVNGLLGTGSNLALYVLGPALGGIVAVAAGPGVALLIDGATSVLLLVIVRAVVPNREAAIDGIRMRASAWGALRRTPVAAYLFVVLFFFNFLYMPVEVALPLLVTGDLRASGATLGALWSVFGIGALIGGLLTIALRKIPAQPLLLGIIAAWGLSVVGLAVAPTVLAAMIAFAVGGLVWAPFTPVIYSYVQSILASNEEQSVLMLWVAGATVAAPLGLAMGGPLVSIAGVRGGLMVSAVLTIALVPLAVAGLRRANNQVPDLETGKIHH